MDNMVVSMDNLLLPEANWVSIIIAATPFVLMGARYFLYRWLAKVIRSSIAELRKEISRLEALIAELKATLRSR